MNEKKESFMSELFIEEIWPEFYKMRIKNERTGTEYIRCIKILCEKLLRKDFLEITEKDAEIAFRKMAQKNLSKRTIKTRLTIYNAVSKFIEEIYPEVGFYNPFSKIERPVIDDKISPTKIPSLKELDQILSAAKAEPMYYLIIALSNRTGMSASNIMKITKEAIVCENGRVGILVLTNTKRTRVVILPEDIEQIFTNYVESIAETDEAGHIFYNKHGNALTLKNIDDNIARIVHSAGIEESYTLKDIRSRAILDMLDSGADEYVVQEYVGLGRIRMLQYLEARSIVNGCPADMVNYQIKKDTT